MVVAHRPPTLSPVVSTREGVLALAASWYRDRAGLLGLRIIDPWVILREQLEDFDPGLTLTADALPDVVMAHGTIEGVRRVRIRIGRNVPALFEMHLVAVATIDALRRRAGLVLAVAPGGVSQRHQLRFRLQPCP